MLTSSAILGGDFHRCSSVDVCGVPQSWLDAAVPQPPIIEQKFLVEFELQAQRQEHDGGEQDVERKLDEESDVAEANEIFLVLPVDPGNLIIPEGTVYEIGRASCRERVCQYV